MVFHPNYGFLFDVMPPRGQLRAEAHRAHAAGFPLHLLGRIRKSVLDAHVLVYRLNTRQVRPAAFGNAISKVLIDIAAQAEPYAFEVSLCTDAQYPPITLINPGTERCFSPVPLV